MAERSTTRVAVTAPPLPPDAGERRAARGGRRARPDRRGRLRHRRATCTPSCRCKGFDVDAAYSGQAALHRCSVERFDVILLDLGLPGLDGLTFLQRLRDELRRQRRCCVISARSDLADKLAGFAHGADDS